MNPVTLVLQGKDEPLAQACGKCGRVYGLGDRYAERCCAPAMCDCGAEARKGWTVCDTCRRRKNDEREAARRAAAAVVEWDGEGMLYDARGDRWFSDLDDVWDWDENGEITYVYASTPKPLALDAESMVLNALEDHYEDADVEPHRVRTLQQMLDDWCADTGIVTYLPDFSRVVLVPTSAPEEA